MRFHSKSYLRLVTPHFQRAKANELELAQEKLEALREVYRLFKNGLISEELYKHLHSKTVEAFDAFLAGEDSARTARYWAVVRKERAA